MPQQNPTASNAKSETFATGYATADFLEVPGSGMIQWFIKKPITIPAEFTSIELVWHIRTPIDAANAPVIYFFSNLTPGEETITWADGNTVTLPSAIGGGAAGDYPCIVKYGLGPKFPGCSVGLPGATDPINQSNFVRLSGAGGQVYADTTLTSPLQIVFAAAAIGVPPTLDATLYHTFYK